MSIRPEDNLDDDDDVVPTSTVSGRNPAKPNAPALPTQSQTQSIPFGSVGSSSRTNESGRSFIQRRVDGGTTFTSAKLVRNWSKTGDNSYRMGPFEDDPSIAMLSLDELGAELRDCKRERRETQLAARLPLIDAAGAKLLDLMESLHANGWGTGLMHAGNIFLRIRSSSVEEVLLADLGFYYDPDMAGTPHWLESYPARHLLAADDDPLKRQKAWKPVAGYVAHDLVLFVKLMTTALTGETSGVGPLSGFGPWKAFQEVLAGTIASPAALKIRLNVAGERPSDGLREPPPVPDRNSTSTGTGVTPPPRKSKWLPIAGFVSLFALAGALYFADPFDWQAVPAPVEVAQIVPESPKATEPKPVELKVIEPKAIEPKPVEPKVIEPKPVDPLATAKVLEAAANVSNVAAEKRGGALTELVKQMAGRENSPEGTALLDKPRTAYLDGWISRYKVAAKDIEDREKWPEIVEKLRQIDGELQDILKVLPSGSEAQKKREAECLEAAKVRIRELQK